MPRELRSLKFSVVASITVSSSAFLRVVFYAGMRRSRRCNDALKKRKKKTKKIDTTRILTGTGETHIRSLSNLRLSVPKARTKGRSSFSKSHFRRALSRPSCPFYQSTLLCTRSCFFCKTATSRPTLLHYSPNNLDTFPIK